MVELWRRTYFPRVIKHFLETLFSGKSFKFKDIKRHPEINKDYTKNIKKLMEDSYKTIREIEIEIKKAKKNEKINNRNEIFKLTRKYMSNRYKNKYNCTLKGIFNYLEKNHTELMKKAKISSISTFIRLYGEK